MLCSCGQGEDGTGFSPFPLSWVQLKRNGVRLATEPPFLLPHRVFILDILGAIYDVEHLAILVQIASPVRMFSTISSSLLATGVPITPDFNSNLVLRHRTSSRLWPDPQCPQHLAVRSTRYAALFALKEVCALIPSDLRTTDSDPVETFCPRSPQTRL
jgi:hypothetical protein